MGYQDYTRTSQYAYVNGLDGAKAYQLLPNQSMLLMDSENPIFYLKTANQMGQSNIRCFKFQEVPLETTSKYATIESVNALNDKLDQILRRMTNESTVPTVPADAGK